MAQDPSVSDMRYFLALGETKNITRAAEVMAISQPAMSAALNRLESACDAILVRRLKTGIELTQSGLRFFDEARIIIERIEAIKKLNRIGSQEPVGLFRFGAHPALASLCFPTTTREIYRDFAQIEIEFVHGLSRYLTEQVLAGKIDFAVIVNPTPHPNLTIVELTKDQVSLWASPKLEQTDTLLYNPDMIQAKHLIKQVGNTKGLSFSREVRSDHLQMLAEMAVNGLGVAILPGSVAMKFEKKGKLEFFDSELPSFHDRIAFVYNQDRQDVKIARLITHYFKGFFIS